MIPTQVSPNGSLFAGDAWAETIDLPTHYTNADGTQGSAINWSGSTFVASSLQLPAGVSFTITPNLGASPPNVVISLTGAQTAQLTTNSFRWYLAESPIVGATILWRLVEITEAR